MSRGYVCRFLTRAITIHLERTAWAPAQVIINSEPHTLGPILHNFHSFTGLFDLLSRVLKSSYRPLRAAEANANCLLACLLAQLGNLSYELQSTMHT